MKNIVDILLKSPDSQLDQSLKEMIRKWSIPPKSVEVLEVLDMAVRAALASDVAIDILDILYKAALKDEHTTHEEVVKLATWRTEAT